VLSGNAVTNQRHPVVADVPASGELPGSLEAVDQLERQDGIAGIDGHRRHVPAVNPGNTAIRPTQFYVGAAQDAGSFITITVSLVFRNPGEVCCDRRIRWRRRSSARISRNRLTSALVRGQAGALVRRPTYDLKGDESAGPALKSDADLRFARRDSDTFITAPARARWGRTSAAVVDPSPRVRGIDGCASRTDRSCRRSSTPPPTPRA
jgi:hypothetical protein